MSDSVKSKASVIKSTLVNSPKSLKENEEVLRLRKELEQSNKTLLEIQEKYINLLENGKDVKNTIESTKMPNYTDITDIEITTTIGQIFDIIWIIIIVALMIYSICRRGSIICSI